MDSGNKNPSWKVLEDGAVYRVTKDGDYRQLLTGTLDRLVLELTSVVIGRPDTNFMTVFLATLQTFSTTSEVLDALQRRYVQVKSQWEEGGSVDPKPWELGRIASIINIWLDQYSEDFEPNDIKQLIKFADLDMRPEDRILVKGKAAEILQSRVISPFESDSPYGFRICLCDPFMGCTCGYEKQVMGEQVDIRKIDPSLIAEQLTLMDGELFKRVDPRYCLGHFWSQRSKPEFSRYSQSIRLTVQQFNAVAQRVSASILHSSSKMVDNNAVSRSKTIRHWIEVAMECRHLKNLSSLKAIISSLQSAPIFRIRKSWSHVPKDTFSMFETLVALVSEDKNQESSRELLVNEGTLTYIPVGTGTRYPFVRRRSGPLMKTVGTVPYLGMFLTDLEMLNSALPSLDENGFINFEKRRKEFMVIAQIKLLQSAAKIYKYEPDERFMAWFHSQETYGDSQSFAISVQLEPPPVVKESPRRSMSDNSLDVKDGTEGTLGSALLDSTPPKEGSLIRVMACNSPIPSQVKGIWIQPVDKVSYVIGLAIEKLALDPALDYQLMQILPEKTIVFTKSSLLYHAMNKKDQFPLFKLVTPTSSGAKTVMESSDKDRITVNVFSDDGVLPGQLQSIMVQPQDTISTVICSAFGKLGLSGSEKDYQVEQVTHDRAFPLSMSAPISSVVDRKDKPLVLKLIKNIPTSEEVESSSAAGVSRSTPQRVRGLIARLYGQGSPPVSTL